ncbi:MAG: hypothetical protein VX641_00310 [Planctomycetota bacterium]|nr:hypothetical protein [Planctomycetota bacterium]
MTDHEDNHRTNAEPDAEIVAPGGLTNLASDPTPPRRFGARLEAWLSRLSTRNAFWNKVCSLIWLPYAFRSGISFRRLDTDTFTAVLPFRRFNRNWYNAMAGAALLGNSEVAAGMYLFGECGSDYIVICKQMRYRFLRPCFGPAIYHIVNTEDLQAKMREGGEFNIELEMDIRQHMRKPKTKQHRVGRCFITFHCTPKDMYRKQRVRTKKREARRPAEDPATPRLPEPDDHRPSTLAGTNEARDTIAN